MSDQQIAELVEQTNEKYQQAQEEQEAFLETVAEEEGAEVLEAQVNLVGDYVVTATAKLDGKLMDRLAHIDERLGETDETRLYEVPEAADDASQLLADLIEEEQYHKEKFYQVYQEQGLEALGTFLERIFEGLENARERKRGVADGFRSE